MSESSPGIIICPACGRRFRWKAELAGRQAKCSCGNLIDVPTEPPGDDLYELAEPAARAPAPVAPGARSATPPAVKPGINYRAVAPGGDKFSAEKLRDVRAPVALIVIGVGVQWIAAWMRSSHSSAALSATLMVVSVELVIDTVFMLIAIFVATRLRGIAMGPFWSAVLKLAAISIAPPSFIMLIFPLLFCIPFLGWLVGAAIEFCLFFALLGYFFDLDESDTWFCVIVMILVSLAIFVATPLILRLV